MKKGRLRKEIMCSDRNIKEKKRGPPQNKSTVSIFGVDTVQ